MRKYPTLLLDFSFYPSNLIGYIGNSPEATFLLQVFVVMVETSPELQHFEAERQSETTREPAEARRFASGDLFAHSREIRIEHNGATYTLRITRSGGLILNK